MPGKDNMESVDKKDPAEAMESVPLPDHPAAEEEALHLRQTCDTIDREIREVEALTGAKAGKHMDVRMKEDPDQQEEVTMQLFRAQLDRLRQLSMAAGQAFFARLDFIPDDCPPETWYLGRWGVLDPATLTPVVVDWRSPVANLYYSGQIGQMDYEAPDGRVEGELTLKRMLNVRERQLLSLFDSGIVSQEAYLQEVLGSVSSDRLREIVTTIQAEQNIVIRHPLDAHLLVQGVAGSGKSSIALHRIAYLLYTWQKTLKPENMMILAPNPLFLSYISRVLPDLGVERVVQTTFEGWCRDCMGRHMPKLLCESRLERNLSLSEKDRLKAGHLLRLKGSLFLMKKLEAYLAHLQETVLPENGFRMAGVTLMDQAEAGQVFLRDLRYYPLEQRIAEMKKIIRKRVHAAIDLLKDRYTKSAEQMIDGIRASMGDGEPRRQKIRALYEMRDQRHREIDARAEEYLRKYREKFSLPDLIGVYQSFLREYVPDSQDAEDEKSLRQEDLPMLVMICRALYGIAVKPMRHIVIDECQDFSPFQIELLKQIYPAATFTLVGDLYQGIRADEGIRSWEEWKGPVFHDQAALKQLTVSYRNTVEIMTLAQAVSSRYPISGIGETKPVLRHGEAPKIIRATNDRERLSLIQDQVRTWLAEGYHSIALIEKTAEQARKLFRRIDPALNAHLLSESDADYRGGVMILPAGIVKGMEFDCVGICDVSAENFPDDEFLCRVLYVLMTRPLHQLTLWYKDAPSPLLPFAG